MLEDVIADDVMEDKKITELNIGVDVITWLDRAGTVSVRVDETVDVGKDPATVESNILWAIMDVVITGVDDRIGNDPSIVVML